MRVPCRKIDIANLPLTNKCINGIFNKQKNSKKNLRDCLPDLVKNWSFNRLFSLISVFKDNFWITINLDTNWAFPVYLRCLAHPEAGFSGLKTVKRLIEILCLVPRPAKSLIPEADAERILKQALNTELISDVLSFRLQIYASTRPAIRECYKSLQNQ